MLNSVKAMNDKETKEYIDALKATALYRRCRVFDADGNFLDGGYIAGFTACGAEAGGSVMAAVQTDTGKRVFRAWGSPRLEVLEERESRPGAVRRKGVPDPSDLYKMAEPYFENVGRKVTFADFGTAMWKGGVIEDLCFGKGEGFFYRIRYSVRFRPETCKRSVHASRLEIGETLPDVEKMREKCRRKFLARVKKAAAVRKTPLDRAVAAEKAVADARRLLEAAERELAEARREAEKYLGGEKDG